MLVPHSVACLVDGYGDASSSLDLPLIRASATLHLDAQQKLTGRQGVSLLPGFPTILQMVEYTPW